VAAGQAAAAMPVLALALAPLNDTPARAPDRAIERQRAALLLAQARARLDLGDRAAAQAQLVSLSTLLEPMTEPPDPAGARDVWLMLGEVRWLLSGLEPRRRADWLQGAVAAYTQAHALQPLGGEALRHFQQAGGRL
jgi:hypothetical protein